jgi:hypothetical protein
MFSRYHTTALVAVAFGAFELARYVNGEQVAWSDLRPFSIIVSIVWLSVLAFDRWLWRLPFLPRSVVATPNISGTWKADLASEWVHPETKEKHSGPISGFMVVDQTYSRLGMRLFTAESSSRLIAHGLEPKEFNVVFVAGVYQNEPDISFRGKRSEIHYGALRLEVKDRPATLLEGSYWTDRASRGSMKLGDRRREAWFKANPTTFEAARALYES